MNRTAAVAFPITLLLAWAFYVITRGGNGPGLKWDRVPNNVSFSAGMTGVAYVIFMIIALTVLYFQRVRGSSASAMSVMTPALTRFAVVYVGAVAAGCALGELYALADERAFRRETAKFMATVKPDSASGIYPLYSRYRWRPNFGNSLVSPEHPAQPR